MVPGGGFTKSERRKQGQRGAGFSARAQDASTAFGNPAGMTRLDSLTFLGGFPLNFFSLKFSVDSASFGGGNGGNAGSVIPGFGFYYVNHPIPQLPDLKLGFSLNSYIGGIVNYDDSWAGRFYTQDAELLTVHASPVAAYPIAPWLSIGAGVDVILGRIKQETAINNVLDTVADGSINIEESSLGAGGNVGLLVQPSTKLRFGVTYRSPVSLRFKNAAVIQGLGPNILDSLLVRKLLGSEVELDETMPQEIQLGFYYDVTDKLSIMADGNWQDWSNFGELNIQIPNAAIGTLSVKQQLNDTWHAALGLHYRLLPVLTLMGGFGFDSSPVDKANRTPNFPVDRQFRYAGGLQYALSQYVALGGSYENIGLGAAQIDQHRGPLAGTLIGSYSSNDINVVTVYANVQL